MLKGLIFKNFTCTNYLTSTFLMPKHKFGVFGSIFLPNVLKTLLCFGLVSTISMVIVCFQYVVQNLKKCYLNLLVSVQTVLLKCSVILAGNKKFGVWRSGVWIGFNFCTMLSIRESQIYVYSFVGTNPLETHFS